MSLRVLVRRVELEVSGGTAEQRREWAKRCAEQQRMKLANWWGVEGGTVVCLERHDLPKRERWNAVGSESES